MLIRTAWVVPWLPAGARLIRHTDTVSLSYCSKSHTDNGLDRALAARLIGHTDAVSFLYWSSNVDRNGLGRASAARLIGRTDAARRAMPGVPWCLAEHPTAQL